MVGEDRVIMSVKELRRVHGIRQTMEKKLTQVQAGALLGLTPRHIRRLIKRVAQAGDPGLAHRGRGSPRIGGSRSRSRRRPSGSRRSGMEILGRPWRRRSWPRATGSRSAQRPCEAGDGTQASTPSHGGNARTGRGGSGKRMWGSWCSSMGRTMTGSRGVGRAAC